MKRVLFFLTCCLVCNMHLNASGPGQKGEDPLSEMVRLMGLASTRPLEAGDYRRLDRLLNLDSMPQADREQASSGMRPPVHTAAAAASSAPDRLTIEDAITFVRENAAHVFDPTPWQALQRYKPQSKYGTGALDTLYKECWRCVGQFQSAAVNFFTRRDSLSATAHTAMAAFVFTGQENNHDELHQVIRHYFNPLQPAVQSMIEAYCKQKKIFIQQDLPTLLVTKSHPANGLVTLYHYVIREGAQLLPMVIAHRRGQPLTYNCPYSRSPDQYLCFDAEGRLITGDCLSVQKRQEKPLIATLCAFYGAGRGDDSFMQYPHELTLMDPRDGDTDYRRLVAQIMGDGSGPIGLMPLPSTDVDRAVVDYLLLEELATSASDAATAGDAAASLLLPPPPVATTSAAAASASTADEEEMSTHPELERQRQILEAACRAKLEAEWAQRQQWVKEGAPRQQQTRQQQTRQQQTHQQQTPHKRGQKQARNKQKRSQAMAQQQEPALDLAEIQQRVAQELGEGRVKHRQLLGALFYALRQAPATQRTQLMFDFRQHGSHLVAHATGASTTATLVRPHGSHDNTMPAFRARSFAQAILRMAFSSTNPTEGESI